MNALANGLNNTNVAQLQLPSKQELYDLPMAEMVKRLELQNPVIENWIYEDPRWQEMETVDAGEIFQPHVPKKTGLKITRPKHRHPKCIEANPKYIPQVDVLRKVLAWWCSQQVLSLFLTGETGTGKSEMVLWFADRMNWPISMVQVNESLRPEKLQGSFTLLGDTMPFRHGPVSQAMKYGWCLLLDECDKGSSDLLAKLHMPVEGKPWQMDDTGEIITPHKNYRCIATGNTKGGGDMTGRYQSSQRLDEAFRRRFAWIECGYPSPEIELKILKEVAPSIPEACRKKMVSLACELRQGLATDDGNGEMSCAFSTRLLVAWATYIVVFGVNGEPIRTSFNFVFGTSLDPEDEEAVYGIIQRIFDDTFDSPAADCDL